ncbi:hypothetical protein GGH99_003100 [Coemansia sp. RSA 1285]|nr:hypothetical protein GGH99_003100 [Coemansia sp. RSA 1285]
MGSKSADRKENGVSKNKKSIKEPEKTRRIKDKVPNDGKGKKHIDVAATSRVSAKRKRSGNVSSSSSSGDSEDESGSDTSDSSSSSDDNSSSDSDSDSDTSSKSDSSSSSSSKSSDSETDSTSESDSDSDSSDSSSDLSSGSSSDSASGSQSDDDLPPNAKKHIKEQKAALSQVQTIKQGLAPYVATNLDLMNQQKTSSLVDADRTTKEKFKALYMDHVTTGFGTDLDRLRKEEDIDEEGLEMLVDVLEAAVDSFC